jgi:hypothetical protein
MKVGSNYIKETFQKISALALDDKRGNVEESGFETEK